jgi:uncharacterized transporter YbjL
MFEMKKSWQKWLEYVGISHASAYLIRIQIILNNLTCLKLGHNHHKEAETRWKYHREGTQQPTLRAGKTKLNPSWAK